MNSLSSTKIYISLLIFLSLFIGTYYAQKDLISLSQPPMFGGTDQLDYNNMAYSMMKTNIPGVMITDEYKKPFQKYLKDSPENRYLKRTINTKNKNLKPYAYRPLLYSIVLGVNYKVFGYSFSVARFFNIFCIMLGTVLLFLIIRNLTNHHIAFAGAILYIVLPNVIKYANLLLSEIFVVTMVIIFLYFLQKSVALGQKKYWFYAGLAFGLLVLSKQMFFLMTLPIFGIIIFYLLKENKRELIFYFLVPYFILIFPWLTYNIAITGTTELKTGTSGWHDMPSAYTKEYLEGVNRFKIREKIFKRYEIEYHVHIRSDVSSALYGKKIFFSMIKKQDTFLRLPQLMYYKMKLALSSNYYSYLILFIISLISLFYLYTIKTFSTYILSIYTIAYLNLLIISLTFADAGRLISSTFPIFIIICAVLVYNMYKNWRKYV